MAIHQEPARDRLTGLTAVAIQRPGLVLGVSLLCAALLLPGALRLGLDNAPEVFFVDDAVQLRQFEALELHFGRDRLLRIVIEGPGLWTPSGLAWLATLEREATALRGVLGAAGLAGHSAWQAEQWPPDDPLAWRSWALEDTVSRNAGWVGASGNTLTVLVALYRLAPTEQRATLAELEALLIGAPVDVRATLAGLPIVSIALDDELLAFLARVLPPLMALSLLIVTLMLRRPSHVMQPFVLLALTLVGVFGTMGYLGVTLNLVTIVLMPLVLVVTLATSLHVLLRYRRIAAAGQVGEITVVATFREKTAPVVWAGVTTALAFGSLAFASVAPVRTLGVWAAYSFVLMTLVQLSVGPALMAVIARRTKVSSSTAWERRVSHWGARSATWTAKTRPGVLLFFAATGLAFLAGVPSLRIDTHLLNYFPAEHPLRSTLATLDREEIGAVSADIVIVPPTGSDRLDTPAQLVRTAELARDLRGVPGVVGAVSAADLVAAVRARSGEPGGNDGWRLALEELRADADRSLMLDRFLTRDGERMRITLFLPLDDYEALLPRFDQAVEQSRRAFPGAEVHVTGRYSLVLVAQRELLESMLTSLVVTILAIALVFRLVLGSSLVAVRALLPSLWPLAFLVGVMVWLDIPVDSTTVMIAAAVLGLAVDDSLHALGDFTRLRTGMSATKAAVATLERTAGAHVLSSMVLAAGFALCATSTLVPIARFGALTAAAIGMALLADLLLLPALLAEDDEGGKEK